MGNMQAWASYSRVADDCVRRYTRKHRNQVVLVQVNPGL